MMVGVDQARQNDVIFEVEDGIGRFRQLMGRPYLFDDIVTHEQAPVFNFAPLIVHGNENGRILD